jgi:hypothetical protein
MRHSIAVEMRQITRLSAQIPHQFLVAAVFSLFQYWMRAHSIAHVVAAVQAHFQLLCVCGCNQDLKQHIGIVLFCLKIFLQYFLSGLILSGRKIIDAHFQSHSQTSR